MRVKKALSLMLLAPLAASLLAGCGSSASTQSSNSSSASAGTSASTESAATTEAAESAGSSSGDATEITMWGWNAGDIEKIFDAYVEDTGANVTLNYVTVQQTEAFQKLQTTVSAGLDMPDIVPSEAGQRGTMIDLGIWEDLSADPYNFDTSNIFEYQINLCSSEDGKLVALPMDISSAALAYKKALAKEYLGTDDPDELADMLSDWDAFLEKGEEVKEKSNGTVFMFASLTGVKQILDGQNPEPVITNDTLDMSSPNKTIETMAKFRDAGIVDNLDETSAAYSASYADDVHIFYPCASWTPAYTIAPNDPNGKDRWGLIIPPEGCYSWGGTANMIPSGALHKDEAYAFLNWMASVDGCKIIHDVVNWNDSNPAMYEDPDYAHLYDENFGDQDIGEILFVKAMENIQVRPVSKYDATISDAWTLVTQAMTSDTSIDAAGGEEMFANELKNKIDGLQ